MIFAVIRKMSKARGLFIENEQPKRSKKVWKVGITLPLFWKWRETHSLFWKERNAHSLAKGCHGSKCGEVAKLVIETGPQVFSGSRNHILDNVLRSYEYISTRHNPAVLVHQAISLRTFRRGHDLNTKLWIEMSLSFCQEVLGIVGNLSAALLRRGLHT